MKNYIVIILVVLFAWQAIFSQEEILPGDFQSCPPLGENNSVITHALPISFILPRHEDVLPRLEQNVDGGPDYKFWNTFEYWSKPGQNLIEELPMMDMGLNPSEMYWDAMPWLNPYEPSVPYDWTAYTNIAANEMMTPENGWELMSMNLGFFPNITPERIPVNWNGGNNNMRGIPFMAFYNKYTSTFRVFFRRGNNTSDFTQTDIAYLRVRLTGSDQQALSGLLRIAGAYDQALDIPTFYYKAAAVCPNPGGAQNWFVGEFKMAFDPCICERKTEIAIDFEFVNTGKLDINGVALGITQDITAGGDLVNNDFFGAFNDVAEGNQKDGYLIYKQINSALDEYIKKYNDYLNALSEVNKHNKRAENNLKILKFAKLAISTAGAAFGVPSAVGAIAAIVPALIDTKSDGTKWITDSKQKDFWKKTDEVVEEAVKFFAGESMQNKEKPNAPYMPTVSTTEMKFTGTLTYSTTNTGWRMQVPGSQDANSINPNYPVRYPLFNETLGSFAVLKTPKIEVAEKDDGVSTVISPNAQYILHQFANCVNDPDYSEHGCPFYDSWKSNCENVESPYFAKSSTSGDLRKFIGKNIIQSRRVQLNITEDFAYAFNNIVPLKSTDVEAQLLLTVTPKFKSNAPSWMTVAGDYTEDWTKFLIGDYGNVNLFSNVFDASDPLAGQITVGEPKKLESQRLPIGALENLIMQFSLQVNSFIPFKKVQCNHTQSYYTFHENIPDNFDPFEFIDFEYEFEVKFFAEIDYDVQFNQYNYGLVPTLNTFTGEYEYPIINNTDLVMHEVRTLKIPSEPVTGLGIPTQTFVTYQPTSFIPDVWPGSHFDIGTPNLTFSDTHFNGSAIEGCVLIGNHYRCWSYDEVNIIGHLTVAPNYTVEIESATQINVATVDIYEEDAIGNPVYVETVTGVVEPEIILQINPGIIEINPSHPMSPEAVKNFCNSKYYANHASSLAPYNPEDDDILEDTDENYQIEISLYPNPTNESSLVTFTLEEAAYVELFLTSISGEVLSQTVSYDATPGDFRHLINLQSFENGIYLLVIQINGKRYVKRIVKI